MKILVISEYFHPKNVGGGEISAFLLAKELAKCGVTIHILTSYFPNQKKHEIINNVTIHRTISTGKNPKNILNNIKRHFVFEKSLKKELIKLDKTENFDVIHCMNTTSVVAVKLKNKIDKPFVMHVNGPTAFCPKGTLMYKDKRTCTIECDKLNYLGCYVNSKTLGKMKLNLFRKFNPLVFCGIRIRYEKYQKLMKQIDFFTPNSNYMKKRLIKQGTSKNKIKIIHNINHFNKSKIKKNKIKKILYLGEYSYHKGPKLLIEALKQIKEEYNCNFYGSGELENYLKFKSKNLNVTINSKIPYAEVSNVINEHDIIILPSLVSEAFPRVVLEGCAAGKTVIASDIGGVRDIIEDKKTGILFEPGNTRELTNLLKKVLSGNIKLDKNIISESINKKFSNKKTISNLKKIYAKLSK